MKREEKSRQTIFAIRDWRKKNGEFRGSKAKCAQELNLSYQTVIKKWDQSEPKEDTVKQLDHPEKNANDAEIKSQATPKTADVKKEDQTTSFENQQLKTEQEKTKEVTKTLDGNSLISIMKKSQQTQDVNDDENFKNTDNNDQTKEDHIVSSQDDDEIDPALKIAEERALTEGIKPSDGAKPYVKKTEDPKPTKKKSFFDRFKKKNKKETLSSKNDPVQEDHKKIKANSKVQNSYLDASHRYRDRFRELAAQNTWLKIFLVASVLILLGAFALVIETSNRSSFIPYVITVDQHGNAVSTGIAKPVADKIEDRVVRSALTGFINNMRTVTVDKIMLAEQQWNIYSMLDQSDPAYQKSVEWLTGEDPETDGKTPFERAASEIVHVKFVSVVNMTPDTLQIEWIETARDRKGQKKAPAKPMRALVTWKKGVAPSELDGIQRNPYGIFIRDFSWTEIH